MSVFVISSWYSNIAAVHLSYYWVSHEFYIVFSNDIRFFFIIHIFFTWSECLVGLAWRNGSRWEQCCSAIHNSSACHCTCTSCQLWYIRSVRWGILIIECILSPFFFYWLSPALGAFKFSHSFSFYPFPFLVALAFPLPLPVLSCTSFVLQALGQRQWPLCWVHGK